MKVPFDVEVRIARESNLRLIDKAHSLKLRSLKICVDWSLSSWSLRLPDGRAVRGSSGFPIQFKTPGQAFTYATRHLRDLRAQILNPYWGWVEVGSREDLLGKKGPRYVRRPSWERRCRKLATA